MGLVPSVAEATPVRGVGEDVLSPAEGAVEATAGEGDRPAPASFLAIDRRCKADRGGCGDDSPSVWTAWSRGRFAGRGRGDWAGVGRIWSGGDADAPGRRFSRCPESESAWTFATGPKTSPSCNKTQANLTERGDPERKTKRIGMRAVNRRGKKQRLERVDKVDQRQPLTFLLPVFPEPGDRLVHVEPVMP